MRFLAFTDVHEKKINMDAVSRKADRADALISAGDFTFFENDPKKMMDWMASFGKPVFFVNGNHESADIVEHLAKKHSNLHFVHKKKFEWKGFCFTGFGGGGFRAREPEFESFQKRLRIEPGLRPVLLTHAPPYGTRLDLLYGEHRGCKTSIDFIRKFKPAYHFCGHFHENFGAIQKFESTTLVNPGPKGMILEIN